MLRVPRPPENVSSAAPIYRSKWLGAGRRRTALDLPRDRWRRHEPREHDAALHASPQAAARGRLHDPLLSTVWSAVPRKTSATTRTLPWKRGCTEVVRETLPRRCGRSGAAR